MENEIWRDVVGYEGKYKISNLGNIYSYYSKRNMNPSYDKGYKKVVLRGGDIPKKNTMIHILVALTFLDKDYIKKGLVCNHIDMVRDNNNISNLEIVTKRYNTSFAKGTGKNTGVTFFRGRYVAAITYLKKSYHLGAYGNNEDAHNKYLEAVNAINSGCFDFENLKKKVNTVTGIKNIRFDNEGKKYFAHITINKKNIRGKRFSDLIDAQIDLESLYKEHGFIDKVQKIYTQNKI